MRQEMITSRTRSDSSFLHFPVIHFPVINGPVCLRSDRLVGYCFFRVFSVFRGLKIFAAHKEGNRLYYEVLNAKGPSHDSLFCHLIFCQN